MHLNALVAFITDCSAGFVRPALRRVRTATAVTFALLFLLSPVSARQQTPAQPTFRSGTDLVVVNVVVRDKNGDLVRDLTREDFTLVEDNRPQTISTFDFEQLDLAGTATPEQADAAPSPPTLSGASGAIDPIRARPVVDLSGHRLLVLFFDLSSMQQEDVGRAVKSARDYVDERMSKADMVAVVSLGTSLRVNQEFTADREALTAVLNRLDPLTASGFEETVPPAATETGSAESFVPDDSEFNVFNTDRRLDALRTLTDAMSGIEQKKSVIYFSSGMSQSGLDNRAALGSLTDRAVRANVAIYTVDARGLQAVVPGGEAQSASARGVGAFSGEAMESARGRFDASQDTLLELAEDTGGRAFLDQNDFKPVFDQVVRDTTAYYLLGYSSTNPARDGRFRRIKVTVRRPEVKLEYRSGYYAPRDFSHSTRDDRELQLQQQLTSELPVTDMPVHGEAGFFRLKDKRFFVPLWLIVPGSYVPFLRSNDTDRATLDVLGVVRDSQQRPVAWIRETVKLSVAATREVRRRNVQYDTSFELPPGRYHLRVVLRENQNGTFGSLDTTLVVPSLEAADPKVSSVAVGTLRPSAGKRKTTPLARDGQEFVPNVAHIVANGQPISMFFEVYDPAPAPATNEASRAPRASDRQAASSGGSVQVLSSVACFRGSQRAYQTEVITTDRITAPDRKAVGLTLALPAGALKPGLYTCQVNVVDDVAGTFAFPRLPVYVAR